MLPKIFTIAFLYLKTTYSSRSTLFFSLAMPLLFTFVLGQALANDGPGEGDVSIRLAVTDYDQSAISRSLIQRLEANPNVRVWEVAEETALTELEETLSAALVIKAGFAADLQEGEVTSLTFFQNSNEISQAQLLREALTAASAELAGSFAAVDLSTRIADQLVLLGDQSEDVRRAYQAAAFEAAEQEWQSGAPIIVQTDTISRVETNTGPDGASQSSPGMLVMYALFFTFSGGASLLVERDQGTLRRLLVMPLGKGTLMTGKLLGIYLGALVQMTIMVLGGQFLFGVPWGQDPAALVLMLLCYGLTGTSLGLLLASLSKTTAQVSAAGTIAMMSLAALGGAWWSIEIVPEWMRALALGLPTGWAMQGFHDIITRGLGFDAVLLEAGILLLFASLFFAIGLWRFKYE